MSYNWSPAENQRRKGRKMNEFLHGSTKDYALLCMCNGSVEAARKIKSQEPSSGFFKNKSQEDAFKDELMNKFMGNKW